MLGIAQAIARAFFEIYRALVVIINGSIRLLEKAGIVNEVKTIQATIDEHFSVQQSFLTVCS